MEEEQEENNTLSVSKHSKFMESNDESDQSSSGDNEFDEVYII